MLPPLQRETMLSCPNFDFVCKLRSRNRGRRGNCADKVLALLHSRYCLDALAEFQFQGIKSPHMISRCNGATKAQNCRTPHLAPAHVGSSILEAMQ